MESENEYNKRRQQQLDNIHAFVANEQSASNSIEFKQIENLSNEELESIDENRREQGKLLAQKIYDLTNVKREKHLIKYIEVVHQTVLHLPSADNQAILETAKEYFLDTYGGILRGKGQSPSMFDQIIHRTGRETRIDVAKLLQGFDVALISREIWDLALAKDLETHKKILAYMQDLTNEQVRELREYYNTMPARLLAEMIHTALNQKDTAGKLQANKEELVYILQGRSAEECQKIEYQFNQNYHFLRYGDVEHELREQIVEKLPEDQHELLTLLDGFNPNLIADNIIAILNNCAEVGEGNTNCQTLHPDFAGKFRSNPESAELWVKEIRARDAIDDAIYYLTMEQFEEVLNILKSEYSVELTPYLYSCTKKKNARDVALNLYKAFFQTDQCIFHTRHDDYLNEQDLYQVKDEFRLSSNKELRDIIKQRAIEIRAQDCLIKVKQALTALECLNPEDTYDVRLSFIATTGIELIDFVEAGILDICRGEVPENVKLYVSSRLVGIPRINISADLFDLFPNAKKRVEQAYLLERNHEKKAEALERARRVQRIILRNQPEEEKVQAITSILKECSIIECHLIEKSYLEINEDKKPLIRQMQEIFSPENIQIIEAQLCGFDPDAIAQGLQFEPRNLLYMLQEPIKHCELLSASYRKIFAEELFTACETWFAGEEKQKVHAWSATLAVESQSLKQLLSLTEPFKDQDLRELLNLVRRDYSTLLALEASYNRYFSRFRFCFERFSGTLMQRLRILATQEIIPRPYFAKSVLLIEGLEENTAEQLYMLLDPASISEQEIRDVHSILRRDLEKMVTVKKTFNSLDKDNTLRDTIHNLAIPLQHKNKTLLLLDGYDPDLIAQECYELIKTKSEEDLGIELCFILNEKSNSRNIPVHSNWTQEMRHQIRVAYEEISGNKLITDLFKRNVPLKGQGIHAVAYMLYGDAAKVAVDLAALIKLLLENQNSPDLSALKICKKLEDLVPAMRERTIDMYEAYFSRTRPQYPEFTLKTFKPYLPSEYYNRLEKLLKETFDWDKIEKEHSLSEIDNFLDQLDAALG
jgi:hypothetical protein